MTKKTNGAARSISGMMDIYTHKGAPRWLIDGCVPVAAGREIADIARKYGMGLIVHTDY